MNPWVLRPLHSYVFRESRIKAKLNSRYNKKTLCFHKEFFSGKGTNY